MNVVGNVEACEMSTDNFLVEGFSVVCDPYFSLSEVVRTSHGFFRAGEFADDFGDTFGLFFGG